MSAPTVAEPIITSSADIQAQHDALTAQLEARRAEYAAASAAFDSATAIAVMSEARARRDTLAELCRRLEAERATLDEPLKRAQEREYQERCRGQVEAGKAIGGEKIAELHRVFLEFAREQVAPLMAEIEQAEENAWRAAHALNKPLRPSEQLQAHWLPFSESGYNYLSHAASAAMDLVRHADRRR